MNNIFDFINGIIYINSLSYPDRLSNVTEQLKKINVDINDPRCKKIEALYPQKNQIPSGFNGRIGHYGCLYSHAMSYKYIESLNNGYYLILEDDIFIIDNFLMHFTKMINDIDNFFDIFYLYNIKNDTDPLKSYNSGLLKHKKAPKLTHAYIINSSFYLYKNYFQDIPYLLDHCNCRHHIDIILREYIPFKYIYTSKTTIIEQNRKKFKSHIKNSKRCIH